MSKNIAALFRSVCDFVKLHETRDLKGLEDFRRRLVLAVDTVEGGNFLFGHALTGQSPDLGIGIPFAQYRTKLRSAAIAPQSNPLWKAAALKNVPIAVPQEHTHIFATDAERRLTNCVLTYPQIPRGEGQPVLRYVHIRAKEDLRVLFGNCWMDASTGVMVDDGPGNQGRLASQTIGESIWWHYPGVFRGGGGGGGGGSRPPVGAGPNLRPPR
jgi:hypothetical protein